MTVPLLRPWIVHGLTALLLVAAGSVCRHLLVFNVGDNAYLNVWATGWLLTVAAVPSVLALLPGVAGRIAAVVATVCLWLVAVLAALIVLPFAVLITATLVAERRGPAGNPVALAYLLATVVVAATLATAWQLRRRRPRPAPDLLDSGERAG
jgi:Na+/melibiose symporter-like transporter